MVGGAGARRLAVVAVTVVAACLPVAASAYNYTQFAFGSSKSGANTRETEISTANVGTLTRVVDTGIAMPGVADSSPVVEQGVATPSGARDLVFLTTKAGHVLAYDANSGALVWNQAFPYSCTSSNGGACYTTSSPVLDPSGAYVYSYALDGKVHRLNPATGADVTGGGWPEVATIKPWNEKGSSALSIITDRSGVSRLYVTNGGYPGDAGDYQGHITVINLANGSQTVFNVVCTNQGSVHFADHQGGQAGPYCPSVQSAVWARAGVVYDRYHDLVLAATGNGDFTPGSEYWGDSIVSFHPDGTGSNGGPVGSYTPANYPTLQSQDADLGSTAPVIVQTQPGSAVPRLIAQAGKQYTSGGSAYTVLRLINLDSLTASPGSTGGEIFNANIPQQGDITTQPVTWVQPGGTPDAPGTTWIYVDSWNGMYAYQLRYDANRMPYVFLAWSASGGGSSPVIANGVLYRFTGNLEAYDPVTGNRLFIDTSPGGVHWESPAVANGHVYETDDSGNLWIWAVTPPAPPSRGATCSPYGRWAPVGGVSASGWTCTVGPVPQRAEPITNVTAAPASPAAQPSQPGGVPPPPWAGDRPRDAIRSF